MDLALKKDIEKIDAEQKSAQTMETRETLKEIRKNLLDLNELLNAGYISRDVYDYHKNKILNSYILD